MRKRRDKRVARDALHREEFVAEGKKRAEIKKESERVEHSPSP